MKIKSWKDLQYSTNIDVIDKLQQYAITLDNDLQNSKPKRKYKTLKQKQACKQTVLGLVMFLFSFSCVCLWIYLEFVK